MLSQFLNLTIRSPSWSWWKWELVVGSLLSGSWKDLELAGRWSADPQLTISSSHWDDGWRLLPTAVAVELRMRMVAAIRGALPAAVPPEPRTRQEEEEEGAERNPAPRLRRRRRMRGWEGSTVSQVGSHPSTIQFALTHLLLTWWDPNLAHWMLH